MCNKQPLLQSLYYKAPRSQILIIKIFYSVMVNFDWNSLLSLYLEQLIPKYCHFDSSQFFQIMGLKNSTINKLQINYSKYLYYFNLGVPTKNGIINKNQTFWNCFGQLSEKASNLSKSQIIRSTALTFYISLK